MSLSTVIQGLLVSRVPEYEISNDAIGYLNDFSSKVLQQLINEAAQSADPAITEDQVSNSIKKIFPESWSLLISREASEQVNSQSDDKDITLKREISDFELIDDDGGSPKVETENSSNTRNLFLSADFIKAYLPPVISARIDTNACIYLAVCLENLLATLIKQSTFTLQNHSDPMAITKLALVETIQQDALLSQLARSLHLYPTSAETPELDFEPVAEGAQEPYEEIVQITQSPSHQVEQSEAVKETGTDVIEEAERQIKEDEVEHQINGQEAEHQIREQEAEHQIKEQEEEKHGAIETTHELKVEPETSQPIGEQEVEHNAPAESDVKQPISSEEPAVEVAVQPIFQQPLPISNADTEDSIVGEPDEGLAVVESENDLLEDNELENDDLIANQDPRNVDKISKPVFDLYGRSCPYFDVSTLAIQMLSSIVELFIRHLIGETNRIAHPHTKALKQHARAAISRLTVFQSTLVDGIPSSDSTLFREYVDDCLIQNAPKNIVWDLDLKDYVSDVVTYVCSRILLVAASHARTTSSWSITSDGIAVASLHFVSSSSPITKLVKRLQEQSTATGEGPILPPPPAPRIRAAQMLYLSSIIKETPLQLDNQLLVVFMFLVSLSIHTLCCVK